MNMLRAGGVHKKKPEATTGQLTAGKCLSAPELVVKQVLSTSWALLLVELQGLSCHLSALAKAHRFPLQTTYHIHSITSYLSNRVIPLAH